MSDYEREMAKLSEVAAWTPEQQAEAAASILAAGGLAADLEAALAADPSLLHDSDDCAVCDTNPGPCSCNAGARYAALVTAVRAQRDLLRRFVDVGAGFVDGCTDCFTGALEDLIREAAPHVTTEGSP